MKKCQTQEYIRYPKYYLCILDPVYQERLYFFIDSSLKLSQKRELRIFSSSQRVSLFWSSYFFLRSPLYKYTHKTNPQYTPLLAWEVWNVFIFQYCTIKSNLTTSYSKKKTLQFVGCDSIKTGEEESSGNVDCFVHCRKKNIIGCPEDNFSTTAHH